MNGRPVHAAFMPHLEACRSPNMHSPTTLVVARRRVFFRKQLDRIVGLLSVSSPCQVLKAWTKLSWITLCHDALSRPSLANYFLGDCKYSCVPSCVRLSHRGSLQLSGYKSARLSHQTSTERSHVRSRRSTLAVHFSSFDTTER